MSCPYKVKPLPHEFCQECIANGCFPWDDNPLLLCGELGGLLPNVYVTENGVIIKCASFRRVDEDMWMAHLSDLKREAKLNEETRMRAMHGEAFSSEMLPAERATAKHRCVHRCVRCNGLFAEPDITYAPDPYHSDINQDDTPVWECDKCRRESHDDI